MEQQMVLFVEDMATGEKRTGTALPLTDELMATFFPEQGDDEVVCVGIEELLSTAREYGAKLGRLTYVEGKMVDAVMDASIISFVDGIHAVHRLDAEEREQLRNAAFVAAYNQAATTHASS